MVDAVFGDPRLAAIYDEVDDDRTAPRCPSSQLGQGRSRQPASSPPSAAAEAAMREAFDLAFEPQHGRAVLVDGRWLVARETACLVLGWAGRGCTP